MSKPAAGDYYIINRVMSPSGDKLAITSNGQGNVTTVTPLTNAASQQWSLVNYSDGKNQSVSPKGVLSLQCGLSGSTVVVLPSKGYVFFIRGGSDAPYTIQGGGGGAARWSVTTATNDAEVAWGIIGVYQEWILQPV